MRLSYLFTVSLSWLVFSWAVILPEVALSQVEETEKSKPQEAGATATTAREKEKRSAWRPELLDTVELKDGTFLRGKIVEPGGNVVNLELMAGSRPILKKEILRVTFARERRAAEKPSEDMVVLPSGKKLYGTVKNLEGGKIEIKLSNRTTLTFDRREVKVVLRDEIYASPTRYYSQELEESINKALEDLATDDEEGRQRATSFLTDCGIFAIERVEKARGEFTEKSSPVAAALAQVSRNYRLGELVTDEMQEVAPEIYEILTTGTVEKKQSLLKALLPAFADQAVDLVVYLVKEPWEDPNIRSFCLEFLRRMQKNRAILKLYNESDLLKDQQLKLVTAVALVRNRVFVALPTLIEGLTLQSEELRLLAAKTLRESTEQDLGFRASGAPAARAAAVAQWRRWWSENRTDLEAVSRAILQRGGAETPERGVATELWRRAHEVWKQKNVELAEQLLREALSTDPMFVKAGISLAVILYTERNKLSEASQVLQDLVQRMLPVASASDKSWICLELGHVRRLQRRYEQALQAYNECIAVTPKRIPAILGAAECSWLLATHGEALTGSDRRDHLEAALEALQSARKLLEANMRDLLALRTSDLPILESLPFEPRAYNRTVLEVRSSYESELIRVFIKTARVRALLGDRKEAVLALQDALANISLSPRLAEAKELEVEVRSYLGVNYETLGKSALALREYQKVVRDLDPKNETCLRGLERLKREIDRPPQG